MLLHLFIKDFVLIERLELTFDKGFTVFTGETGAGKSIVLDALSLALGMRGDTSFIRQGCDQTTVIAEFSIPSDPSFTLFLQNHGFQLESTLIVKRILNRFSPSRAYINDELVGLQLLKHVGERLFSIHGQFDRLLQVDGYLSLLDESLQDKTLLQEVKAVYKKWKNLVKEVQQTKERKDLYQKEEIETLITSLKTLQPKEAEEQVLLEQRQTLLQTHKISETIQQSLNLIKDNHLLSTLHQIGKLLEKYPTSEDDPMTLALCAIKRSCIELQEAQEQLLSKHYLLNHNPFTLQHIEDRLHDLRSFARKLSLPPSELPKALERFEKERDLINERQKDLEDLEQKALQAKKEFLEKAEKLSQLRQQAAYELAINVEKEAQTLALPHCRFVIKQTPLLEWNENGLDAFSFLVSMNKGQDFTPLHKTASGGEKSRLMLALKTVLSTSIPTLIFDEIDSGVSGSTAFAMGQKLSYLGKSHQVIAVTHSPQVAALASSHYVVQKEEQAHYVITKVIPLLKDQRTQEIARMLSGEEISLEAEKAAKKLLSSL